MRTDRRNQIGIHINPFKKTFLFKVHLRKDYLRRVLFRHFHKSQVNFIVTEQYLVVKENTYLN